MAAVLVLALGGYAYATLSSDGESGSSGNQESSAGTGVGDDPKDQGVPDESNDSNETGESRLDQQEGESETDPAPEPEPPEPPGTSQSQPDTSISGYIAQLGSFTDRAGAETRLARLESRGLTVGILWSGDYPQMAPGYWVVYAGPFDSKALADSAAESSGVRDAFSREISPG